MALLQTLIPNQNLEVVRDQIGAIIFLELQNQKTLSVDTEDIIVFDSPVFIERVSPFENDEVNIINVQLSEGAYDNENAESSDGAYTYFIDIYTTAAAKSGSRSDSRSKFRLQRLIGAIRAILKNSNYVRLGNDSLPPIISGSTITRFQIQESQDNKDAQSVSFARLTLNVRVNETTQPILPTDLNEYHTQVKLVDTEKGLRYENVVTP